MSHVSSKNVEKPWSEKIFDLLFSAVIHAPSAHKRQKVLKELLTDTERLMLAKRIALLAMITAGFSSYTIWRRLKVSPGTTKRYRKMRRNGNYGSVAEELARLRHKEEFWEDLDSLSRLGAPPIAGKKYQPTLLKKRKPQGH